MQNIGRNARNYAMREIDRFFDCDPGEPYVIRGSFLERDPCEISRETFHIRPGLESRSGSFRPKFFTPEEDGSDIILGQSRRGTKSAAALSAPISNVEAEESRYVVYDRSRTDNRKQSDKAAERKSRALNETSSSSVDAWRRVEARPNIYSPTGQSAL